MVDYDILPLPPAFSVDTNGPTPARRVAISDISEDDVGRKVRVYGRVVKTFDQHPFFLLHDDIPRPSTSTSNSTSTSTPPAPTPATSLPISLLPLLSESFPLTPGPSSSSQAALTSSSSSSSSYDPDAGYKTGYGVGYWPAGSGRDLEQKIGSGRKRVGEILDEMEGLKQRERAGLRLQEGEGVCVVGWVERMDEKTYSTLLSTLTSPIPHPPERIKPLLIRAHHISNQSNYFPIPGPATMSGAVAEGNEEGIGEGEGGKGRRGEKRGWGKRRGLEEWDQA